MFHSIKYILLVVINLGVKYCKENELKLLLSWSKQRLNMSLRVSISIVTIRNIAQHKDHILGYYLLVLLKASRRRAFRKTVKEPKFINYDNGNRAII